MLEKIASDFNQIYFTLLYGYFKATNKFFTDLNEDKNLDYIASNVLKISIDTDAVSLTKSTLYRYQQIIKQHLRINEYTDEIKDILVKEATTLANNFIHRKKIFYALVEFSKKLSIEVPSHTELYRIITVAINSQKRDILERLTPFVQDQKLGVLDEFLQKDGDYKNRWSLTHYKILEHSTKKAAITVSLQKFKTIQSKFNILESIFISGGITPKIAQYHAKWIENNWMIPEDAKKPADIGALLTQTQTTSNIRPLLKWAGGKGQLLQEIAAYYPFRDKQFTKYAEPFLGGGTVLFDVLNHFSLEAVYISDVNQDLINTYQVIRNHVDALVKLLNRFQSSACSSRAAYCASSRASCASPAASPSSGASARSASPPPHRA